MAYALAADVATELGRTLTGPQTTQATDLIASAQAVIDAYCRRTFEASTLITDELHLVEGPYLYLDQAPIASVSSVKVRSTGIGSALTTLVAGTGYEVLSAADGVISLSPGYDVVSSLGEDLTGMYALVTYTPAVTVPADIKRATVLLVAGWMQGSLDGGMAGVKRFQVGGELTVEYATSADLPAPVLAILKHRRSAAGAFA